MRQRTAIILSCVIVVLGAFRVAVPAFSATLSGAPQRLTVYGGALTVMQRHCSVATTTSCTTSANCPSGQTCVGTLELGATSTDLASDTAIVFRPGTVPGLHCSISTAIPCTTDASCPSEETCTAAVSDPSKFTGRNASSTVQDLTISNNLHLTTVGKAVCLQGSCKTAWNSGFESWAEQWIPMGTWTQKVLVPVDLALGVSVGSATRRTTSGTAVSTEGLLAMNIAEGTAATFNGNVRNIMDLTVRNDIRGSGSPVWTGRNDGQGSGLDAMKLDGVAVTLRNGNDCGATACVCFTGTPARHANIDLTATRCIPLSARINL